MNNPHHPAHREIKDILREDLGRMLLKDFFHSVLPSYSGQIWFHTIEEFPIPRYRGIKVNGSPYAATDYVDFIFLLKPGAQAIYHRECFSIGVEIKTTFCDIQNAVQQVEKYKGYTDYFIILTSDYLIPQTIRYAGKEDWIGVASFNTGKLHKIPKKVSVSDSLRADMLLRLLFCPNQDGMKKDFILPPGYVPSGTTGQHHKRSVPYVPDVLTVQSVPNGSDVQIVQKVIGGTVGQGDNVKNYVNL